MSVFAVALASCGDEPTRPVNHDPIINVATAQPGSIGPSDSTWIILDAWDPDGDALVYDFIGDGTTYIKHACHGVFLFDSRSDTATIFQGLVATPPDTAWIECSARDLRGGADIVLVRVILTP